MRAVRAAIQDSSLYVGNSALLLIKVQPYICHSYLGCLKDSVEFALRCRVDLHIIDIQKMGDFPVYGLRWFVPFRDLQLLRYRIETQRKKPRAQSVTLWEPLVKVDDVRCFHSLPCSNCYLRVPALT